MSGDHRTLRPAIGGLERAESQSSLQVTQSRRKRQLNSACKNCREKKTKCPGQRPTCQQCRARAVECIYETLPGETRAASLKSKNDRMKNDLNTMMELYWYLQTRPKEDAANALAAIQTGAEPSQVMESLNSSDSSHDALHSMMDARDGRHLDADAQDWNMSSSGARNETVTTWDQHLHHSGHQAPLHGEASESGRGTETYLLGTESPVVQSPIAQPILYPSNTITALISGVDAFFSYTDCIFHVYHHSEAQELLGAVQPCIKDAGDGWPGLILQDSAPMHLRTPLCSVCIMAAIGLQYTKDPIPALGLEPSAENGTYPYAAVFYELAKHLMEAVIEDNVLEAVKVCAAMCMYNIIGHATIALANADMGINFALSLGPSFQQCPAGLNEATWLNYKRVTRTLVTLRNWMTATLGYVPGDNPGFRAAIHGLMDQRDLAPNEVIQHELAKVLQLEANLLRAVDSFGDISPPVLSSTRRDLTQWYEQLPRWMHLDALVKSSDLTIGTRRTLFLVHLFYLSANILVARLAHGGQSSLRPSHDIEGLRIAAGDGVLAARTASRMLQLQLDEQTIFHRCWLCEFTSYVSSLMLLHSTAQLLLYGYPQCVWEQELSYAKSCLDILEYCGKADKVALHFADTTRSFFNTLTAHAQGDKDLSAVHMPEEFDYLFGNPELSAAHLGQVSRDLLELVKCPFGKPSNLQTEGTLRAGFGSQLDWNAIVRLPFNKSTPEAADSVSQVEMALVSLRSGYFIGSSQPHGWGSLLNPNNL